MKCWSFMLVLTSKFFFTNVEIKLHSHIHLFHSWMLRQYYTRTTIQECVFLRLPEGWRETGAHLKAPATQLSTNSAPASLSSLPYYKSWYCWTCLILRVLYTLRQYVLEIYCIIHDAKYCKVYNALLVGVGRKGHDDMSEVGQSEDKMSACILWWQV